MLPQLLRSLTLRFDDAASERAFEEYYWTRSLTQARFALVTGIVLYATFAQADAILAPESSRSFWLIRFGFVCPIVGLVLAASFAPRARDTLQPLLAIASLSGAIGLTAMMSIADVEVVTLYYAGLLLLVMWTCVFSRLRLRLAVPTCLSVLVMFQIPALWLNPVNRSLAIYFNLVLFSAILLGLLATYTVEHYMKQHFVQEQQIQAERERAEELLYLILPQPVAQRLRAAQPIADSFADVTVLFADIVNFSALTPQLPPGQLVGLLNRVFGRFDELADRHGLEKIKTIGDAYMVAGGIPTSRDDHAEAVARFALDIRDEIQKGLEEYGQLSFRIGINTGPVIAGVIGRKRFIYDLWGDTVNLANRMQSNASPGSILVTEASYQRLRRHFEFGDAVRVQLKGRGEANAYVLRTPRVGVPTAEAETVSR